MKAMYSLLLVGLALLSTLAGADDVVLVPPFIAYANDETANDDVRKECTWNTSMPHYLAKESAGRIQVAEQGFDSTSDKKLLLVATHLHTAGGGRWSGPKWLVLEGTLMEKGRVLGNFEVRRQTIRGSMRGCGTLESLSEEISDDILLWLKNPSGNAKLGNAG